MSRDVRLTDAEREALADTLRGHLSDGRITIEEFEHRVGIVYAARLLSDADPAFHQLPPPLPGTDQPPRRSRGRRHAEATRPEPHWHPTDEVFRDPTTGRVMRVWVDPTDGSRHYIAR